MNKQIIQRTEIGYLSFRIGVSFAFAVRARPVCLLGLVAATLGVIVLFAGRIAAFRLLQSPNCSFISLFSVDTSINHFICFFFL